MQAAFLDFGDQRFRIRRPGEGMHVLVEIGAERSVLPLGAVVELELLAVRLEPRRLHGEVGDQLAVGRKGG